MGRVYVAEDHALKRRVAIKVLKNGGESSSHRRLLREARAAARISHPNLCPVFDVGEDRRWPFIATELLSGETLAERLERGALSREEILPLTRDMLGALGALHDAGIIHRDIKPSNVFLTAHGAKLLDFGLARPLPRDLAGASAYSGEGSDPGSLAGTPSYMAPEQLLGRPLDERTDLFSAGIVLYQAVTGRHPFAGPTAAQVLSGILHEQPTAVSGDSTEAFEVPLRRALAKSPSRRFGSAREMLAAFQFIESSSRAGGGTPSTVREVFVGRETELAWLQQRLAEAIAGRGSVVFVTGEAGTGKSALLREFRRRVRSHPEPVTLSMGRCLEPQGPSEPFQPFVDAVHRMLVGPARETVSRLIRAHAPTVGVMMPSSLLPDPGREMQRQTVGATKERYYREAGDFMEASSREIPSLLHLEDMQWADPSSIECLHHLGCRSGRQRTLIVCTYRPADVDAANDRLKRCIVDLVSRGVARELALGPLSAADIESYLDARFPGNRFPRALAGAVHERTEGLALFTRSLVDYLEERDDIGRDDEGWMLRGPVASLDLEPSRGLQDLVRQRVGALPSTDQDLLRLGSLCGRDFLSTIVARLMGLDEQETEERLQRLCSVHRLILDRGAVELPDTTLAIRYRFAHALYQTVLYKELVPSRRTQLHRQVAARLKHHWGTEAPLLGAEIAHHCERGRDFAGAVEFRIHAGDTAAGRFAHDEADEHYEWAARLVDRLPPSERSRAMLEVHRKRGAARHAQGRMDEAAHHFRAMLSRARDTGSDEAEREALGSLCDALALSAGRAEEMSAHVQQLLDLSSRRGKARDLAEARSRLGQVLVSEGRFSEAIPLLDDVITAARSSGASLALQMALGYRGFIHHFQASYHSAERCFGEARALAIDRGDSLHDLMAGFFVAVSKAWVGRVSEGLDDLQSVIALARRNGDRFVVPRLALSHLGALRSQLFAVDEAREYYVEALGLTPDKDSVWAPTLEPLSFLCVDEVRLGNLEGAAASLAQAESGVREIKSYRAISALRFEATAASHWAMRGDWQRAKEHAGRLQAIAKSLEARSYRCKAERIQAEAALVQGERLAEPTRRLADALSALEGFPAPFETWKAARLLGQLRGRLGDETGKRDAFAQSARAVRTIAAGVTDERLRHTFLAAAPVREVLEVVDESEGPQHD